MEQDATAPAQTRVANKTAALFMVSFHLLRAGAAAIRRRHGVRHSWPALTCYFGTLSGSGRNPKSRMPCPRPKPGVEIQGVAIFDALGGEESAPCRHSEKRRDEES